MEIQGLKIWNTSVHSRVHTVADEPTKGEFILKKEKKESKKRIWRVWKRR